MEFNRFYDIHFHSMDLSHANLTAYMKRFFTFKQFTKTVFTSIVKLPVTIFRKIKRLFNKNSDQGTSINKFKNLLSFMESSIKYDFLIVDYFLKNRDQFINSDNSFKLGGETYNKIVLCPLIMDFGYGSLDNSEVFYNIPPQKPIKDQIEDLFSAIDLYFKKDLEIDRENKTTKFIIKDYNKGKESKLFEIYPFMGLNTINYTYKEVEILLNKYFSDFSKEDTKEIRQNKLYNKMGNFKGDLNDYEDCKNIFAGIKLYPPLGFQPWPAEAMERKKVELLYKTACEKNIPITVHCGKGGFDVVKNSKELTDPGNQWEDVLKYYPNLKINFAHFGSGSRKWQKSIVKHINSKKRVYADFSYNINNDVFYKKLTKMIDKNRVLGKRILFGSDFMINLLKFKSYNEYLAIFSDSRKLSSNKKRALANKNPEEFLFV